MDGYKTSVAQSLYSRGNRSEVIAQILLAAAALVSVLVTVGIVVFFVRESLSFFLADEFDIVAFFTDTTWQPMIGRFGIWPVFTATLKVVTIALAFAMPVGIAVAIYLNEFAGSKVRRIAKPIVEVFSGIPTVVFGYFALSFISPLLQEVLGNDVVQLYNNFSAGIAVGILLLPAVISGVDDAFGGVPYRIREAPYAVGATRLDAFRKVVMPASKSGVAATFVLAMSRAFGESMIVAIVAGVGPNLTLNPFVGAETMTGYILRIAQGDLGVGTPDYTSIFALGLILYVVTLSLILVSRRIGGGRVARVR